MKNKVKKYFSKLVFVLPAMILVLSFTIYPIISLIINSFKHYKISDPGNIKFIGLENYFQILKDKVFLQSLLTTISLTIVAVLIELGIGMVIAIILSKSFRGNGAIRSLLVLPIAATPIVVGLTWKLIIEPRIGVLNYFLDKIFGKSPVWLGSQFLSLLTVVSMDVWQWTPFIIIILLAGILGQDKNIYEAALVDGANNFQTATKITIPLLKNVIAIAVLIRATDVFRLFDQVWVLTNGGPGTSTTTLSIYIYKTAFRFFNIGQASSASVIMMIILMTVVIIIIKKVRILEDK
ncbi:MAG: carbohydrate ABC transporter permease [Candidatus Humimicrobiaceae bacterium]